MIWIFHLDCTNAVDLGFEDSTINAEEISFENQEVEENETNRYIELLKYLDVFSSWPSFIHVSVKFNSFNLYAKKSKKSISINYDIIRHPTMTISVDIFLHIVRSWISFLQLIKCINIQVNCSVIVLLEVQHQEIVIHCRIIVEEIRHHL